MATKMRRHPLTEKEIQAAKAPKEKQRALRDSDGLFLLLKPNGSKLWRCRYRINAEERACSLGAYPEVSLADARVARDKSLALVDQGIDPAEHRERMRTIGIDPAKLSHTSFEVIARNWIERIKSEWVPSHAVRNIRRLEQHVFPYIGTWNIQAIKAPDMLKVLRRIEEAGNVETAHRVMQMCGKILQ